MSTTIGGCNFYYFILLIDKSEEIKWMDFETRMRKIIKDLVHPVIERG